MPGMVSPGKNGVAVPTDTLAEDDPAARSRVRAEAAPRWASAWFAHPNDNQLLAALPAAEQQLLAPHLEEVELPRGAVLFEHGAPVEQVHFPYCGTMVSLVVGLRDGRMVEAVTVGCEGAVGAGVDLGDLEVESFARAVVQMPGRAVRLPAARLAQAAADSALLRRRFARQALGLQSMALQSVACNAVHRVPARLARWLLTAQDRSPPGERGDGGMLSLTHEFLAEMLAVRRATVTEALNGLQDAGLIRARRGGVQVLDRTGLEAASCECHAVLRRHWARLLETHG